METTTSTFATKALTTKGQWKDSEKNSILFVDVNGDGLMDILAFDKDSIYWIQNMGGCFAPVRTEENFYTSECSRMLGNFDGDNDMDLLLIPKKGKLRFLMREHETKGFPKITKIREGWNKPPLHIEYGFSQRENGRNEAYNSYPLAQLNRVEVVSSRDRTGSTLYDYYSTGLLRNQKYISAVNPETVLRQIFEYTADHRFLKAHSDTTGTQTYRYDSISGLLLEKQDVRGRKTSYEYDKWGYLAQTIDPDGYRTLHKKGWATSVHPAGACLVVEEKTTPGATLQWYYDKWGNEIGKSNTIGDKRSYTRKIYDKWSRLTGVSEPDFNPTGGMLHLYEYDKENRLKQEIFGNRITTYQYNSLLSEVTQPNGITHVELRDHTGDVIRSQDFIVDGEEVEIVYEYGYPGKMSSVSADGVETRMAYDSYGRQISLSDPSAGVTTVDYNVSDELTHSRDAEGINTTYAYDIQGRETKMQVGDAKVDFRYGNEGNGKDLLVEKSLNNGSHFEYQYDEAGRLTKKTLYKGDTAYTFAYVYDSFGRMVETCYPNGYSVYYVYDGQDNVSRITDNRSRVLWKNPVYDAYGRVVSYEFGKGLRYNVRYNEYGRTTETEYTGADNAKLYVERYTFDSVSQNLLSRSFR